MTQEEKAKILESHKPSDPELAKEYEKNPPRIVEGLEYQPGEGVIGNLPDADFKQFVIRYLNDFGVLLRNFVHFQLRTEKILTFIATNMGIDVTKEFKEDAKRVSAQMEAQQQMLKEQIKNYGKKD